MYSYKIYTLILYNNKLTITYVLSKLFDDIERRNNSINK